MADRMTYAGSGVDYDAMDPFKRKAQLEAIKTSKSLQAKDLQEVEWTRGESVYLVRDLVRKCFWGVVHEGLGTSNLVADAMKAATGSEFHHNIGYKALAVGLNDAATLGVQPTTVTMHLSVGSSKWFADEERSSALIEGWINACQNVGATWAGGETPTLRDILLPTAAELSCAVNGIIASDALPITGEIFDGDAIVLFGSSGIHDNGYTLGRDIAALLEDGYLTLMSDGRAYGEALLDETVLYGPLVKALLDAGIRVRYCINITGHGYRKLMRSRQSMSYVIERIPAPHPVFHFIQEHGNVETKEMYGNYNMGAGWALYVHPDDALAAVRIAKEHGISALKAGYITAADPGTKRVVMEPLGFEWDGQALGVRA